MGGALRKQKVGPQADVDGAEVASNASDRRDGARGDSAQAAISTVYDLEDEEDIANKRNIAGWQRRSGYFLESYPSYTLARNPCYPCLEEAAAMCMHLKGGGVTQVAEDKFEVRFGSVARASLFPDQVSWVPFPSKTCKDEDNRRLAATALHTEIAREDGYETSSKSDGTPRVPGYFDTCPVFAPTQSNPRVMRGGGVAAGPLASALQPSDFVGGGAAETGVIGSARGDGDARRKVGGGPIEHVVVDDTVAGPPALGSLAVKKNPATSIGADNASALLREKKRVLDMWSELELNAACEPPPPKLYIRSTDKFIGGTYGLYEHKKWNGNHVWRKEHTNPSHRKRERGKFAIYLAHTGDSWVLAHTPTPEATDVVGPVAGPVLTRGPYTNADNFSPLVDCYWQDWLGIVISDNQRYDAEEPESAKAIAESKELFVDLKFPPTFKSLGSQKWAKLVYDLQVCRSSCIHR